METTEKQNNAKETSRIESFSDGVFAVAITLLVLDIHVPAAKDNESLLQLILQDWSHYLAFLIGFLTILICWINHHYMFEHIHKSNGMLLLINGFKLLVVSFTPFVTALLSKYIQTPHMHIAVCLYAANFSLMGIAMFGIWSYAYRQGFTQANTPQELKAATQLYIFAGTCSTAIFLLSFATTLGALILSAIMFSIFLFPKKSIAFLMARNGRQKSLVNS